MEEYEEHFGEFSDEGRDPMFSPGWWILPGAVIGAIVMLIVMAFGATAQTAQGTATSGSSANVNTQAGAIAYSGGVTIQSGNGRDASGNAIGSRAAPLNTRSNDTVRYEGSYRVESAPAVSAPAIFGGGHPCLAGKSGGVSIVGGGFSYGQGDPEPACMAWIMGNPEIALMIMHSSSPKFRRATCSVGFWRVGGAKVPVNCSDGKPTTISSKAVTSTKPKGRPALLTKCELSGGKVRVAYTATGRKNKEIAKKQCLSRLGY